MNRVTAISLGIVLLFVIGGLLLFSTSNQSKSPTNTKEEVTTSSESPTQSPSISEKTDSNEDTSTESQTMGETKVFSVEGGNFFFKPNEIRVKSGDKVKVTFTSTGAMHDFVIEELDVTTKVLQNGQSETVEFTVEKSGTYEFYCSVGNHRKMGMTGKLIVE